MNARCRRAAPRLLATAAIAASIPLSGALAREAPAQPAAPAPQEVQRPDIVLFIADDMTQRGPLRRARTASTIYHIFC
jgi:hypothetical protein